MRNAVSFAVITSFLLVGAGGALAQTTGFRDVMGTRYADAYASLSRQGVVEGYRDGTGRPHGAITRVEALKVIVEADPRLRVRAQWFSANLPPVALFQDVDQEAWYAPYIEAAFEAGILTGYPDSTFRPSAPITAEEGIVLLLRSAGEDAPRTHADQAWYGAATKKAFDQNLVSVHEHLRLGDLLTRGQFFDMVYRLGVVRRDNLAAFVEPKWVPPVLPAFATQPSIPLPPSVPTILQPPVPSGAMLSGKPFAISIPSLGISDLTITHPGDPTTQKGLLAVLGSGVGHLFSYPGGDGKIMIYGHSSGYAWDVSKFTKIFRKINELNAGDRVYVTYKGKLHVYQVTYKQAVPSNDLKYFSGDGEELILYTCWPPDSIKERFLVHATPVSDVAVK